MTTQSVLPIPPSAPFVYDETSDFDVFEWKLEPLAAVEMKVVFELKNNKPVEILRANRVIVIPGFTPLFWHFLIEDLKSIAEVTLKVPDLISGLIDAAIALREHFPSEEFILKRGYDPEFGEWDSDLTIHVMVKGKWEEENAKEESFIQNFWLNHDHFNDYYSTMLEFT